MVDVITMEIIRNALEYIAEEMGIVLRNSAFSPNIKERMDHSCAIFGVKGELLAHAEHIPVHLGAMPLAVREAIKVIDEFEEGDMIVMNDPYSCGTHLPDITIIAPVYHREELVGFVANRAHHSDVGGRVPGSMPGDSVEIFEEGLIIPPVRIVKRGKIDKEILRLILANVRTPRIRMGDIIAQISANRRGVERLLRIIDKYGRETYLEAVDHILSYSERLAKTEISKMREGESYACDYLDDAGQNWDKPIKICVRVRIEKGSITFDFSDSDKQVPGSINAPKTVTISASYFVFKSILRGDIPSNEGTYRPLRIITKRGTIVDATHPVAVAGGNVETSQRIVDVLFLALSKLIPERIPAASQGTMNNIAFGGINPKTGRPFTFYETIGGGFGGRRGKDGVDGVHCNMTNTMNTPIEEIERKYPIRILEYSLRSDSCGAGRWRGGLGIIRKYQALTTIKVSLLGDRHRFRPWGLMGGKAGAPGEYILIRNGREIKLPSKTTIIMNPGDILVIKTPGGGGYGKPKQRDKERILKDLLDGKTSRLYVEKHYELDLSKI